MAPDGQATGVRAAPVPRPLHGCWLLMLTAGISMVTLVIVGFFGIIGPIELTIIVGATTLAVFTVDRFRGRGA